MTVASTTRKTALFAGDNATTDFPFAFKVFAAADLLVVRRTIATGVETELTLTTHYAVTLNADQEANPGGIVALVAPLLDTYNLIISSKVSILQPAALANQGGFYPKVIMDALDRLTIISQQLKEDVDRSVKFNISSAYNQFNLPDPAAGQFLRWSADLTTLENGYFSDATLILHSAMMADAVTKSTIAEVLTAMGLDVNIGTLALPANTTISAFIKTLLDDADAGTAQSTLGISAFIKTLLDDANAATARTTLATPAAVDLRGYIAGLGLSNAADTEHDITIAVGTCRDSTNAYTLTLASAITKQIDAGWSAGTDAGGLDTGAVGASTPYYIFLIRKDSDGSIDVLFSASATSPTMPAGYTYFRRIGALRTDSSSNIIPGTWDGDRFTFTQRIVDREYAAVAGTNRILIALSVPPSMIADTIILMASSSGTVYASIGPTTDTDIAPSSYNDSHFTVGTTWYTSDREIKTNASSQIYVRASSTNYGLRVMTLGWIDTRGRDS